MNDEEEREKIRTVILEEYLFNPDNLTVKAGTTVNWMNNDPVDHTVVSQPDESVFKSEPFGVGESYSYTFDKPGEYEYYCSLHPQMRGKITVVE